MTDIALVPQEGTSIKEMMGIPVYSNTGSQSALAQLTLLNKSIMGEGFLLMAISMNVRFL